MYIYFIESKQHTDLELIGLFKQDQNHEYLAPLFKRYMHLVFGVSLKYLKHSENAQDAVMDIFELLPNLLIKHEVKNFKSWLHTVSKNHCLMQLRKDKGIFEINAEEKINQVVMESEEELHLKSEHELQLQQMEKGIETLKPEQQECIKLFYLKEKSYQEIVDETGYDLKKVKSHIQNGKRNLKIYLTGNASLLILFGLNMILYFAKYFRHQ